MHAKQRKLTDQLAKRRKSPKQSKAKELRCELEKGLVPDYHKYNAHVLAAILKVGFGYRNPTVIQEYRSHFQWAESTKRIASLPSWRISERNRSLAKSR